MYESFKHNEMFHLNWTKKQLHTTNPGLTKKVIMSSHFDEKKQGYANIFMVHPGSAGTEKCDLQFPYANLKSHCIVQVYISFTYQTLLNAIKHVQDNNSCRFHANN